MAKLEPTFVKKLLHPFAISSFFEILLLFFIKYSGYVGLFLHLLITSFSIFQVSLNGKQSQCLDHMGLTELIKSNNFQQQSYF